MAGFSASFAVVSVHASGLGSRLGVDRQTCTPVQWNIEQLRIGVRAEYGALLLPICSSWCTPLHVRDLCASRADATVGVTGSGNAELLTRKALCDGRLRQDVVVVTLKNTGCGGRGQVE